MSNLVFTAVFFSFLALAGSASASDTNLLNPIDKNDFELAASDVADQNISYFANLKDRLPDANFKYGMFPDTANVEKILSDLQNQDVYHDYCFIENLDILDRIEICEGCGVEAVIIGDKNRDDVNKNGLGDGVARTSSFYTPIYRLMGYRGKFYQSPFVDVKAHFCNGNITHFIGIYAK